MIHILRMSQVQLLAASWRPLFYILGAICISLILLIHMGSRFSDDEVVETQIEATTTARPMTLPDFAAVVAPDVIGPHNQPIFVGKNFWLPKFEIGKDDWENTKKVYELQVERRREVLENMRVDDFAVMDLYNVLVPEVVCPNLVRIGNVQDGGKWVCNPFAVRDAPPSAVGRNSCAIYSLGIHGEISFDRDIQLVTAQRCRLHAYDWMDQVAEVKEALAGINGDFKRARVTANWGVKGENDFTIPELMAEHGDERIEILKIDIEDHEHTVIPQLLREKRPVCQILIEIHRDPKTATKLLKTMSEHGFYLFAYEPLGHFHYLCEYSLIHEDCFERYGTTMLAKYLS